MSKYHVSPKTGNPGVCKAKSQCPFGGDEDHFPTQEAAAKSYEKKQEVFNDFVAKSVIGQSRGAYTIEIFDINVKDDARTPQFSFAPSPLANKIGKSMQDAAPGTRLVIENGNVWEKSELYNGTSWKFVSGKFDSKYRLEEKKTYDGHYVSRIVQDHGGRLEAGGRRQEMLNTSRPSVGKEFETYASNANKQIHDVTGANANIHFSKDEMTFVPQQGLTKKEISTILKNTPNLKYVGKGEAVSSSDRFLDRERFVAQNASVVSSQN